MSGDDVGTVFTFSADICADVKSRSQWILRVELTNSIWKLSLIELITLYILYALGYHGSGMCLSQSVLFYWRPLLSLVPVLFVFTNTNFTSWPTEDFYYNSCYPVLIKHFALCALFFINQSNCDHLHGLTFMLAWDWFFNHWIGWTCTIPVREMRRQCTT